MKEKKTKTVAPSIKREPQGFLLTKEYKERLTWKESPLYRLTFLLLILGILWVVVVLPRWYILNEWNKATEDQTRTSIEESEWVQSSLAKIRPLRNKYKEIESMLQYRRIAFSPILSSIQRHIPPQISVLRIDWESNLDKTLENITILGKSQTPPPPTAGLGARKARITITLYATKSWSRDTSPAAWLSLVERDLDAMGLQLLKRNIGAENPFVVPPELKEIMPSDEAGTTITISLDLRLGGPKIKTAAEKAGAPKIPIAPRPPKKTN